MSVACSPPLFYRQPLLSIICVYIYMYIYSIYMYIYIYVYTHVAYLLYFFLFYFFFFFFLFFFTTNPWMFNRLTDRDQRISVRTISVSSQRKSRWIGFFCLCPQGWVESLYILWNLFFYLYNISFKNFFHFWCMTYVKKNWKLKKTIFIII